MINTAAAAPDGKMLKEKIKDLMRVKTWRFNIADLYSGGGTQTGYYIGRISGGLMPETSVPVYAPTYCLSNKFGPIIYSKLLYEMGQGFLDSMLRA